MVIILGPAGVLLNYILFFPWIHKYLRLTDRKESSNVTASWLSTLGCYYVINREKDTIRWWIIFPQICVFFLSSSIILHGARCLRARPLRLMIGSGIKWSSNFGRVCSGLCQSEQSRKHQAHLSVGLEMVNEFIEVTMNWTFLFLQDDEVGLQHGSRLPTEAATPREGSQVDGHPTGSSVLRSPTRATLRHHEQDEGCSRNILK